MWEGGRVVTALELFYLEYRHTLPGRSAVGLQEQKQKIRAADIYGVSLAPKVREKNQKNVYIF